MKLSRFQDMLAAYGARIERWPEAAGAQRLLAESTEARAALAEAVRVDRALNGFAPRVDPAVAARLRGTVQRRVARMPAPEASRPWSARHMLLNFSLRFGALAAMAAVGVWIGWSQPIASRVDQPTVDPLAPIQVYPVSDDSP
jgi:hypothetical protein